MMTTTVFDRVGRFVADVAACFDDLPADERAELLEDLEQHLVELAAEDPDRLEVELQDPAAYAAELRASAGLPDGVARRPVLARMRDQVRADVRDRVAALEERLRVRPETAAVLDFLPELRPAWWVLRGWLAVVVVLTVLGSGDLLANAVVPGRSVLGIPAGLVGVVLSVRAGRRSETLGRRARGLTRVGGVVAACAVVVLLMTAAAPPPSGDAGVFVDEMMMDEMMPEEAMTGPGAAPVLTLPGGEPVTNLYVFDTEGRLLRDVLVYDGLGQPVEIGDLARAGFETIDTDLPRDTDGNPVGNLYPLEQYDVRTDADGDGDDEVTRSRRPVPAVDVPDLQGPDVEGPDVQGSDAEGSDATGSTGDGSDSPSPSPSESASATADPDPSGSTGSSTRSTRTDQPSPSPGSDGEAPGPRPSPARE